LLIAKHKDPSQLHSALPPNLNQSQAIFIPINDGKPNIANSGSHWSLLVFLKAASTFYYYDSLQNANINSARITARQLTPLLGLRQHPQLVSMWTPQQPNGADCGVCVIAMTDFLVDKLLAVRGARTSPNQLMQLTSADLAPTHKVRKGLRSMVKELSTL
jgi:sentrin-specific protease 8